MGLNGFDQFMGNGYFRTIWTVAYQFWAHLISVPQLGRPGFFLLFFFSGGGGRWKQTDFSSKYFPFLANQRSAQLLYETLDTLIKTSRQLLELDSLNSQREWQIDGSSTKKKYHYLGTKNNLVGYCCPNYYSIIGPAGVGT